VALATTTQHKPLALLHLLPLRPPLRPPPQPPPIVATEDFQKTTIFAVASLEFNIVTSVVELAT
jgi:hypothetical protein